MSKQVPHKAATVYARTLLELGVEKGLLDSLRVEITTLREVFVLTPAMQRAFAQPVLTREQKKNLLNLLSAHVSDLVKRLLNLLALKHRLALLDPICAEFLRLEEESRNIKRARVVSSHALTESQLTLLAQKLSVQRPGKTYLLKNDVDASLIAGFRIEEDDNVIDASISHKLNVMRHKLVSA